MREKIAFSLIPVALVAGGFFMGRQFPRHHYTAWKNSNLLFDDATGIVCDPLKSLLQKALYAKQATNPIDKALSDNPDPNANIPPCGSE